VPDVSLPYRRLRDLPGLVRRRLGDEPLASTETDGDGAFVVPVDGEPVDAYHVRVYEDETFLGSVDVSDGGGGGGGDRHRSGAGNGRGEQGRNRGGQQGNQGRRRGGQQGGRGGQQGGQQGGQGRPQGGRGGQQGRRRGGQQGGQQGGHGGGPPGGPPGRPPGGGSGGGRGDSGLSISVPGKRAVGAAGGLGLAGLATWYVAFRDDDGDGSSSDDEDDVDDPVGTETDPDRPGDEDDTKDDTQDDTDDTQDDTDDTQDDTDDTDDTDDGDGERYSPRESQSDETTGGDDDRPSFSPDVEEQAKAVYATEDSQQEGHRPEQIRDDRVSVVRGTVVDRAGDPITDVRISVKNHEEFGQTRTDENGEYELAVNGGKNVTFVYQKEGYLQVQRQRVVVTKDNVSVEEVTMVGGEDSEPTQVTMDADQAQAVTGAENTDEDGSRSALLVVPPGTSGGYEDELSFRSLEYTVGDRGEAAMPAELPPRTGYTYALEYLATRTDVRRPFMLTDEREFNQPVIHYSHNFLGFPVGSLVPTGLYNRGDANWEPSDNGRVVEVLDASGDAATLDVDGDGNAASESDLEDLGVTDGELELVAAQFDAGTELWRTPIPHFTPADCNWSILPPWGGSGGGGDGNSGLCSLLGFCGGGGGGSAGEGC